MKNFFIMLILFSILPLKSVLALDFVLPSDPHQRPKAITGEAEEVLPNTYKYQVDFECMELPGRDKRVSYWVLIKDGQRIWQEAIEPCFKERGEYAFTYEGGLRLFKHWLLPLVVSDKPVEIQYFMEIAYSGEQPKIYASTVNTILIPKGFSSAVISSAE